MVLLQVLLQSNTVYIILMGMVGMLTLAIGLIVFIVLHQRRVIRYQQTLQKMEEEQQNILLNASIRLQEEERERLAADLHDDAGPLLATARLYLNENLVYLDQATQIQHIFNAKSILDDAIQLIRNISHSLIPPTLKNFGLESAVTDILQKISGAGRIQTSCQFQDYPQRLVLEREQIIFRIVQELVNNILKHSKPTFINLNQHVAGDDFLIRISHDGQGLTQAVFEQKTKSTGGIGLKNIQSRLKVLQGKIFFEQDPADNYFKATIELPQNEETVTNKP